MEKAEMEKAVAEAMARRLWLAYQWSVPRPKGWVPPSWDTRLPERERWLAVGREGVAILNESAATMLQQLEAAGVDTTALK